MNKNNTLEQLTHKLAGVPLIYQPGTRWYYSEAVDVQAYLVEKLSGEKFVHYLKAHIFGPLKMTHTGYVVSKADRPHLAALYKVTTPKCSRACRIPKPSTTTPTIAAEARQCGADVDDRRLHALCADAPERWLARRRAILKPRRRV